MTLPLVSMQQGGVSVKLLARSIDEYLHRVLAEEDAAGGPRPLAEAAGPAGAELYSPGAMDAAGMAGKLQLYLIRKAGMFPDVCEALSAGHLARGDQTSGLVAAEWYMKGHFPGWGRPFEYASEVYQKLGKRDEEARDMARMALRAPWWTLSSFDADVAASQLRGSPEQVRFALSEEAAAQATGKVTGLNYREARSPREVALDEASKLLDLAFAAGQGYDAALATQLATQYAAAGLSDAANFVKAI